VSGPVLVLATLGEAGVDRSSLETLTIGQTIAASTGATVEMLIVSDATAARGATAGLAGRGVGSALVVDDPRLTTDHPDGWAAAVTQVVRARGAAAVVGPGTERGNELMARVGARLGEPVAANCLTVEPGDRYRLSRQRWAGSLIEECWLDAGVKLLTVAPNTVAVAAAADGVAGPTVEAVPVELSDADLALRVTSREAPEQGRISLGDAKVVVGGGRGVGSTDGFADLEELAALLGGAVGGSRVVTSAGWRPHADQIGQTGLRIAPDVYIACGISGAIQHMAGCMSAKNIVAVNTDPDAPIISRADYAVIGDLNEVIPALIAAIRDRS